MGDVGIANTCTGARPFAAMKGACDGGIDIPHSHHRFVGWGTEDSKKKGELDTDVLRDHILGKHVAEYMEELLDDDEDEYKSQFARYIKEDLEADDIVDMFKEGHANIRKDPSWKNPGKQPRHPARNSASVFARRFFTSQLNTLAMLTSVTVIWSRRWPMSSTRVTRAAFAFFRLSSSNSPC